MKTRTASGAIAILLACLMASANAQVDAQKELEICKAFCTVTKKQCERDLLGPGIAGIGIGIAAVLGEATSRSARHTDISAVTQLPKLGKSGDATPDIQAAQQCEANRLQCAKDCAQPAPIPEKAQ